MPSPHAAHATHRANASGWTQRARTACAAAAGAADQPGVNTGPGASSTSSSSASSKAPPAGFANLELMIANQLGGGPGGDWKQIEGCYVLQPPGDAVPKCLVHFIGGSFVGAAPQLTYRPLLEALAARGALVRSQQPHRLWAGCCSSTQASLLGSWLSASLAHNIAAGQ